MPKWAKTKTMRIPILAIVLSLALAGCSDAPPAGEAASTGHHLTVTGSVTTFETQAFRDPTPTSGTQDCPADQAPVPDDPTPDPFATQRCDRPYTKLTVNFTELPDPQTQSYTLKWYSEASGATEDLKAVSGHVHPTTGAYMAEDVVFDNEADCDDKTADAGCKMDATYDSVQLWLGEILVATAPLQANSPFVLDPGLLGTSFTADYSGKDLTLTVTALGNYTYQGWLITTDEAGVATHAESFTVSAGENTFKAPMNIEEYSDIHIHVAGTKLNVAVGAIA